MLQITSAAIFSAVLAGAVATLSAASPSPGRALLDQYCVTCHNDRVRAAGLVLTGDRVNSDRVSENAAT